MSEAMATRAESGQMQLLALIADELNGRTLELPSFPDIAARVQRAVSDEGCSPETLAAVVHADPVLAARLLKVANSALLGRGTAPVTNLKTAISRLGFQMVRNAATSVALDQLLGAPAYASIRPAMQRLWRHSVSVSALSYVLAGESRTVGTRKPRFNRDEALLAGLMHDIGYLYVWARACDFPDLIDSPDTVSALAREWHCALGRAVLETWGFPEAICDVSENHHGRHCTPGRPASLSDLVWVADWLVHLCEGDEHTAPTDTMLDPMRRLGLDLEHCRSLVSSSNAQVQALILALRGD